MRANGRWLAALPALLIGLAGAGAAQAAELRIKSYSNTVSAGTVTLTMEICNDDTTAAVTANAALWLDRATKPGCTDTDFAGAAPLTLAASSCETIALPVPGLPAGTYTSWIAIDHDCKVTETDETNNTLSTKVLLDAGSDLKVDTLTMVPRAGTKDVDLTLKVCNGGTAPTRGFTLRFWLDRPASARCKTPGDADLVVDAGMGPGECATLADTIAGLPDGTYTTRVYMDAGCVIPEANETNDQKGATFTIGTVAPPARILFSSNATAKKVTLATIKSDGTGYALVSGAPAGMDLMTIFMPGPGGPADVRRDRPVRSALPDGRSYIALPSGDRLVRWGDATNQGLALITAGAGWKELDRATVASGGYGPGVAVTADGKLAAAVKEGKKVVLVRLDGTFWPGSSSPVKVVTPATWTVELAYYSSLTLTRSNVFFSTRDTSTPAVLQSLYRAPLDGSATAGKVTVPLIGGKAIDRIDWFMAVSRDGGTLAFVARSGSGSEEIFTLGESAAAAINVSGAPGNYYNAGTRFMDSRDPRLALSPSGAWVAFAAASTPKRMWIVKSDGTGKKELSTAANFQATIDTYGSFFWRTDDVLLFAAGESSTTQDLFTFTASSGVLANLTTTGTTTAAPWGKGALNVDGGWISPNGRYLYILAGGSTSTLSSVMTIKALDMAAGTLKDITTGLHVRSGANLRDYAEGRAGDARVWFVARSTTAATPHDDVWVFDQNAAAAPVNLTKHTGGTTTVIAQGSLAVSPNGTQVAYLVGAASSKSRRLMAVASAGTAAPAPLAISYIGGVFAWLPDSTGVAYGGGTISGSALDLYVARLGGLPPKALYTAGTYVDVFAAAK